MIFKIRLLATYRVLNFTIYVLLIYKYKYHIYSLTHKMKFYVLKNDILSFINQTDIPKLYFDIKRQLNINFTNQTKVIFIFLHLCLVSIK